VLAFAPDVFAQAAADKPKPLSSSDKKFLKDSTTTMYYLLDLIGQGKTRASTSEGKALCEQLNGDLDKIWGDVAGLATANEIELPGELKGADKSQAERLKKAEGLKWDKDFLKIADREVKSLTRSFTSAESSQNGEIKAVSEKWKPTIAAYTAEIEKTEKEIAKAK
jgi:hypothetical protein